MQKSASQAGKTIILSTYIRNLEFFCTSYMSIAQVTTSCIANLQYFKVDFLFKMNENKFQTKRVKLISNS